MSTMPKFEHASEWRHVEGFPGYIVTACGEVWGCRRNGNGRTYKDEWRIMKQRVGRDGYYNVPLRCETSRPSMPVHRMVLYAFSGKPGGLQCRHLNGNSLDNHIENLRWGTHAENARDRVRHGTMPKGENNHNAKLTSSEVVAIREMRKRHIGKKCGVVSFMSRWFGVCHQTISDTSKGKYWKHIK